MDKSSIDEPEDMQLARMARPLMQKGQGRPISRMGGEKSEEEMMIDKKKIKKL